MEIKLNEIDVQKINLQPDEVLIVKMRGDEFCNTDTLVSLKNELQLIFPNNRVSVLCMPSDHDIQFDVIATQNKTVEAPSPCSVPGEKNFCNDCGCGKKATWERKNGKAE